MSVPVNASDVTRVLAVRAQIAGGAADVTKASVRVLPNAQPDLSLGALDEEGSLSAWTSEGQLSPTSQTLAQVWSAAETRSFALKIKNTSAQAATFALKLPDVPDGWQLKIYDALQDGVLLQSDGEGNIATPSIDAGKSVTWRIEVAAQAVEQAAAAPAGVAPAGVAQVNLPLRASGGALFDQVEVGAAVQSLAGLQWSADGSNWQNVTGATLLSIEQYATVGLRAVKSLPDVGWPTAQPMGPQWDWQGESTEGETMWMQGKTGTVAGGAISRAMLGTTLDAKIRVLPESDVQLNLSRRELMAGAGPADLTTTTVAARVVDAQGEPLAGQKVRFRARHEDESSAGTWQSGGGAPVLTTDAQGNVSMVWTTDNIEGDANFEAVLLTDSGQERPFSSHQSINVNAPYVTATLGQWTEGAGGWSRSVEVSTWFGKAKVAGLNVALTAQITDYETEAPVAGWQNAAPFDAATGVSDANGNFVTVQRWNPVEAGAWSHDFEVTAEGKIN